MKKVPTKNKRAYSAKPKRKGTAKPSTKRATTRPPRRKKSGGASAPYAPLGGPAPPERKQLKSHSASIPRSIRQAEDIMEQNARIYAATIMDPFEVREGRIPDQTPYPSTVGSSIMRYTLGEFDDGTLNVCGGSFGIDPTAGGYWNYTVTAVVAGVPTWNGVVHPHNTAFASNFHLIRTVSMGIRFLNIATIVSRGGALFVAYSATPPTTNNIAALKLSDECEVYDAARLDEEGLQVPWLPLSRGVVYDHKDSSTPTGQTYVNPSLTLTSKFTDTYITVWIEGTTGQDLTLEIEQVHNWEAIPHPTHEYLFERQSVIGSEDKNAAAISTIGGNTAIAARPSEFTKEVKGLLSSGVAQIASYALRGLTSLPGMLIGALMGRHQAAVGLGLIQFSPVNYPAARTMTQIDFVRLLTEQTTLMMVREQKKEKRDRKVQEN